MARGLPMLLIGLSGVALGAVFLLLAGLSVRPDLEMDPVWEGEAPTTATFVADPARVYWVYAESPANLTVDVEDSAGRAAFTSCGSTCTHEPSMDHVGTVQVTGDGAATIDLTGAGRVLLYASGDGLVGWILGGLGTCCIGMVVTIIGVVMMLRGGGRAPTDLVIIPDTYAQERAQGTFGLPAGAPAGPAQVSVRPGDVVIQLPAGAAGPSGQPMPLSGGTALEPSAPHEAPPREAGPTTAGQGAWDDDFAKRGW